MRNPLFSLASCLTVSACIFLLCIFLAMCGNLARIVVRAETKVGITVFFDEGLDDQGKEALKGKIGSFGGVKEIRYISADEAWESFKTGYFGDRAEELSKAFEGDNPLAGSDSFEVFMEDIEDQDAMVGFLREQPGVRDVKFANTVVNALRKVNRGIYALSAIMIGILFAVSVFLISNTINVAAAFRKRENGIMRLIGATDFMISAPFAVEGIMIGLIGALVPLAAVCYLYKKAAEHLLSEISKVSSSGVLKEIAGLIPLGEIFPHMAASGLVLGIGMGFIVSIITIRKHLKV